MAKIYTARDMRDRSDYERKVNGNLISAAMLRQAADALEREEKYEYKVDAEGETYFLESIEDAEQLANALKEVFKIIISRRPVGEWEAVPNG